MQEDCQIVLFWDEGETCPNAGTRTDSDRFGTEDAFPELCEGETLLESSYTRSGDTVPDWYCFMTYFEWNAPYDKPWYTSPAPLPMYGQDMLKLLAESVLFVCTSL